jgi:hypothetical protein
MKHAFAGAVLMVGLLAAATPATAQYAPAPQQYAPPAQDAPPAQNAPAERCYDCPKPRDHYDSQEIVRTTRDVDQSRVINTQSEVVVGRRVKETNHLIVRENQTRDVGVVQHNHTIYEVTPRYVIRVPRVTVVSYVTQRYHVVETPATMTVPVPVRHVTVRVPAGRCAPGVRYDRYSRYEAACRRVLRVRG